MIRSIRLSLRFIVPLALVMLAAAYVAVPVVDSFALRWFMRDLDTRAQLFGSTLEEPLAQAVGSKAWERVDAVLNRASRDERVYGMALCGPDNKVLRRTNSLPSSVDCDLIRNVQPGRGYSLGRGKGRLHITAVPVPAVGAGATLMIVHDMSFIDQRSEDTRLGVLLLFTGLGIVLALITLLIAHMSWRGWVAGVRAMLQGDGVIRPFSQPRPELQPLVGDLRTMLRDLRNERRSHDVGAITWTPAALRSLLNDRLRGDEIIVVSNREPYIHVRGVNSTEVQRPASGLVTAVEPVMRACSGNVDSAWQRFGRSRERRQERSSAGAARESFIHAASHLADARTGKRLLLRLRERRIVAAMPYRACTPGFSRRRLGSIPSSQRTLCRRRS